MISLLRKSSDKVISYVYFDLHCKCFTISNSILTLHKQEINNSHAGTLDSIKSQDEGATNELEKVKKSTTSSIAKLYKNKDWKVWWPAKSYGKHPGTCRLPTVSLPKHLDATANDFLKGYDKETLLTVSAKLSDILFSRRVSRRPHTLPKLQENVKISPVNRNVLEMARLPFEEYQIEAENSKTSFIEKNKHCYNWKKIDYDDINAAAYLVGRSSACYASSLHVLSNIKKNAPDFKPYSMLDFGSGTGMSVWAANTLWKDCLKQYFCVDSSKAMNKLAFYLFSGGDYNKTLSGLFIRHSLPSSANDQYDFVVSSYTLSELPSEKERLKLLKLLWDKTQRFLVLVEHGNFFGYFIMMEARCLLLNGLEGVEKKKAKVWSQFSQPAKIFAPCPHTFDCPKWGTNDACFFTQKYFLPSFYHNLNLKAKPSMNSTFSYIVFEKGKDNAPSETAWPRVIDSPQYRRNCATCHLCTPMGTIEHIPVIKQTYGKDLMYIAKKSDCGDCIPLTPSFHIPKNE